MSVNIKKLSKGQLGAIIAGAILIIALIAGGVYCGVNDETPAQLFNDIVKSNDELIIGKWQGEQAINGYEFKNDGTYDNYLSTFSFSGQYEVDGNKLTLRNVTAGSYVTYKFSINGNKLTIQLINENGVESEDSEKLILKKVDHFNMKSFTDVLEDAAKEAKADSEESDTTDEN